MGVDAPGASVWGGGASEGTPWRFPGDVNLGLLPFPSLLPPPPPPSCMIHPSVPPDLILGTRTIEMTSHHEILHKGLAKKGRVQALAQAIACGDAK